MPDIMHDVLEGALQYEEFMLQKFLFDDRIIAIFLYSRLNPLNLVLQN